MEEVCLFVFLHISSLLRLPVTVQDTQLKQSFLETDVIPKGEEASSSLCGSWLTEGNTSLKPRPQWQLVFGWKEEHTQRKAEASKPARREDGHTP